MRTALEKRALMKIKKGDEVRFIMHDRIVRLLVEANWTTVGKIRCRIIDCQIFNIKILKDNRVLSYDHEGWDLWLNEDSLK